MIVFSVLGTVEYSAFVEGVFSTHEKAIEYVVKNATGPDWKRDNDWSWRCRSRGGDYRTFYIQEQVIDEPRF